MAQDFDLQIKVSSNVETAVKGFESLGDAVKDVSKDFKAASVSSEAASKGIESVDKAIDDISSPLTTGSQKLNDVADALDRIEKATKKFGREFTQNVTAPIAALAALSLKNIFDTAVDGKGTKSMNDFAAAVQNLKKEFDLFLKDIGEQIAPTFTRLANILSGLLEDFRRLSPEVKSFLIIFAGVAAIIGPAALALSGILSIATQLTLIFAKLAPLALGLVKVFAAPMTSVIALIGALGLLSNLMINLQKTGSGIGESIILSFDLVLAYIETKFFKAIGDLFTKIKKTIDDSVLKFTPQGFITSATLGAAASELKELEVLYEENFKRLQEKINAQLAKNGSSISSSLTLGVSEFFDLFDKKQKESNLKLNENLKTTAASAQQIETIFDSLEQEKQMFASGLSNAFLDFAEGAQTAEQAFNNFARNFLRQISQMILQQQLLNLVSGFGLVSGFEGTSSGGGGRTGSAPFAFADGGLVRGAGTGTSDSINAKLSNGEFVMTAASVKKYGAGFFDRINSLTSAGNSFSKKAGHFADGGLASAAGAPQVVIENTGTDKQVSRTEFDPETAITTIFMEDLSKNGPMSKSIQSNFSLKRGGFK